MRLHWQPVEKRKFLPGSRKTETEPSMKSMKKDNEIQFLRKGLGSGKPRTVQENMAKYTRRKSSIWYPDMEKEFYYRSNAESSMDQNNNDESDS